MGYTLIENTLCWREPILPYTRINSWWIEDVLSWLQEHPELKNIVLVNRWAVRSQGVANESGQKVIYQREDGRGADACEVFELGISQLCRRLRGMGKNVIIISSIPEQIVDVPEMLQRFGLFGVENERIGISLQEYIERQAETTETFLKLEKENLARILWVAPFFFDTETSVPLLRPGRVSMYCDDDHLSPSGAKWLLEAIGPQLIQSIE